VDFDRGVSTENIMFEFEELPHKRATPDDVLLTLLRNATEVKMPSSRTKLEHQQRGPTKTAASTAALDEADELWEVWKRILLFVDSCKKSPPGAGFPDALRPPDIPIGLGNLVYVYPQEQNGSTGDYNYAIVAKNYEVKNGAAPQEKPGSVRA
ncbi:unnamed protein product, partial [Amoebophrya sp. A25]